MARRPPQAVWDEMGAEDPPGVAWVRGVPGRRAVVVLGAFDPPTLAHVCLASAAGRAEQAPAAFCLTKVLLARRAARLLAPAERLRLLDEIAESRGFGVAVANRGTYLEVARVLRASGIDAAFVVGSDKLRQLEDPSFYPDGESGVKATFEEVRLLVVPRPGAEVRRSDVRVIDSSEVFENAGMMAISATEVRDRARRGGDIRDLVPPEVARALEGYTSAK